VTEEADNGGFLSYSTGLSLVNSLLSFQEYAPSIVSFELYPRGRRQRQRVRMNWSSSLPKAADEYGLLMFLEISFTLACQVAKDRFASNGFSTRSRLLGMFLGRIDTRYFNLIKHI